MPPYGDVAHVLFSLVVALKCTHVQECFCFWLATLIANQKQPSIFDWRYWRNGRSECSLMFKSAATVWNYKKPISDWPWRNPALHSRKMEDNNFLRGLLIHTVIRISSVVELSGAKVQLAPRVHTVCGAHSDMHSCKSCDVNKHSAFKSVASCMFVPLPFRFGI